VITREREEGKIFGNESTEYPKPWYFGMKNYNFTVQ
jgi:hypothetical protein